MSAQMKLRKLMIVIEENGLENGKGYNVYLSGDTERLATLKAEDMSPAEFWGVRLFSVVTNVLQQVGAVVTKSPKGGH